MNLKHPLRYYLTMQWVDLKGYKVLYTPADEHHFEIRLNGKTLGRLRVIGGYSFVGYEGLDLHKVRPSDYAGEM